MTKQRIFMILLAALLTIRVAATDITGTVSDAKGQPLGFVNVVLMTLPDSTLLQGCTSDENGHFSLTKPNGIAQNVSDANGKANTSMLLKATRIGYRTIWIGLRDFAGTIVMHEDSMLLNTVTVKGQQPRTKLTGNSMVTAVEGSVLSKSGNAEEMLSKVPGIIKNGENLEVLGKGVPVYYINGRKLQDLEELKRLRSEEIKEVEVITTPGAEYDATFSAVVRIKTIKRQDRGFGYDVVLGNEQNIMYGNTSPNATTNVRYRHKSFEIFGMLNYAKTDYTSKQYLNQETFLPLASNEGKYILQQSEYRNDMSHEQLHYNLGFDWQVSEHHSVGLRVERNDLINFRYKFLQNTQMQTAVTNDPSAFAMVNDTSLNSMKNKVPYSWAGNAYYNAKVGKLCMDFNVDFISKKSRQSTDINQWESGSLSYMLSNDLSASHMIADKLVLSYPVWKGQLQGGTEMSFVTRNSIYTISGIDLPSNDSKVQENNLSTFLEYAFNAGKLGQVSAGLRYEYVGFDYKDMLNAPESMSRYTHDLFPSVSWAKQFGCWQTALSYRTMTLRPDYWQLSSAINMLNPYSLQQGDPKLKNEKIQEITANVRWKWLNLMSSYQHRENALTQWSYIYDDKGRVVIKNINMDVPVRQLSMILSAMPTWGIYSPNLMVGFQKCVLRQTMPDVREETGVRQLECHKPIAFARLGNTFRLKHSWQLECNFQYQSRGDYMNFHLVNDRYYLGFSCQKCWLKNDALSLRASINDVLHKNGQKVSTDCGYCQLYNETKPEMNSISVSLRYAFNAQPSKYKGMGAGKDAAGRMSK